jgi:hypothetical protein
MSSLCHYLADEHKIYQQTVVAEELIEARAGVTYRVNPGLGGKLVCPVLECTRQLRGGWMLWRCF